MLFSEHRSLLVFIACRGPEDVDNVIWARVEPYGGTFRVKFVTNAISHTNQFISNAILMDQRTEYTYWIENALSKMNTLSTEERAVRNMPEEDITLHKNLIPFIGGATRLILEQSMGNM